MEKKAFRNLMGDLERRVNDEGKKNPSWLMGFLQGLGMKTLTGFQCAALVDLLLVPLEKKQPAVDAVADPEQTEDVPEEKKELSSKPEEKLPNNLLKTLAQR